MGCATRLFSLAIVLAAFLGGAAYAEWPTLGPATVGRTNRIHPAVVRIIAPLRDGMALGSGTLVAVNETQGLVISNWHVVEDAAGPISIMFPDGFSSTGTVLKADRDWDLAAILIRRPNVEPVPLATRAPRPGEPLTIAGYGPGTYRAATGRCTQYVAPGPNRPLEMVELATSARQGDSGGPIFNAQGELAGVLFGTGGGATMGSYCGRVRGFLASITGDTQPLNREPRAIAQSTTPPLNREPVAIAQHPRQYETRVPTDEAAGRRAVTPLTASMPPPPPTPSPPPLVSMPSPQAEAAKPPVTPMPVNRSVETVSQPAPAVAVASRPMESLGAGAMESQPAAAAPVLSGGIADQLKTVLAVVGLLSILFHGLRLLSLAQGS